MNDESNKIPEQNTIHNQDGVVENSVDQEEKKQGSFDQMGESMHSKLQESVSSKSEALSNPELSTNDDSRSPSQETSSVTSNTQVSNQDNNLNVASSIDQTSLSKESPISEKTELGSSNENSAVISNSDLKSHDSPINTFSELENNSNIPTKNDSEPNLTTSMNESGAKQSEISGEIANEIETKDSAADHVSVGSEPEEKSQGSDSVIAANSGEASNMSHAHVFDQVDTNAADTSKLETNVPDFVKEQNGFGSIDSTSSAENISDGNQIDSSAEEKNKVENKLSDSNSLGGTESSPANTGTTNTDEKITNISQLDTNSTASVSNGVSSEVQKNNVIEVIEGSSPNFSSSEKEETEKTTAIHSDENHSSVPENVADKMDKIPVQNSSDTEVANASQDLPKESAAANSEIPNTELQNELGPIKEGLGETKLEHGSDVTSQSLPNVPNKESGEGMSM